MKFIEEAAKLAENEDQNPEALRAKFLEYLEPNYERYLRQNRAEKRFVEATFTGSLGGIAVSSLSLAFTGSLLLALPLLAVTCLVPTVSAWGFHKYSNRRFEVLNTVNSFSEIYPEIAEEALKELQRKRLTKNMLPRGLRELQQKLKDRDRKKKEIKELRAEERKALELEGHRKILQNGPLKLNMGEKHL